MGVVLPMTIPAKETLLKLGRHTLLLRYMVDRQKWAWKLTVTKTYEYNGSGDNPTECRQAADRILFTVDKTYHG